jgi:hypothetical protein
MVPELTAICCLLRVATQLMQFCYFCLHVFQHIYPISEVGCAAACLKDRILLRTARGQHCSHAWRAVVRY